MFSQEQIKCSNFENNHIFTGRNQANADREGAETCSEEGAEASSGSSGQKDEIRTDQGCQRATTRYSLFVLLLLI